MNLTFRSCHSSTERHNKQDRVVLMFSFYYFTHSHVCFCLSMILFMSLNATNHILFVCCRFICSFVHLCHLCVYVCVPVCAESSRQTSLAGWTGYLSFSCCNFPFACIDHSSIFFGMLTYCNVSLKPLSLDFLLKRLICVCILCVWGGFLMFPFT